MNIDSPCLPPSGGSSAPAPSPAVARPRAAATEAPANASPPAVLRCTHGDFQAARVAALRESIGQGSYRVDLGRVADGLLGHLRDLHGGD